jgi:enoyl-CoA hydratase/carnithine racemase
MSQDVRIGMARDHVLEIVLDRPDKGNAITPAMATQIGEALANLAEDVRVVVIRGEGPDFCTGRAPAMPPPGSRLTAQALTDLIAEPILAFYDSVAQVPVPVLAAVKGRAAGVGCALAGIADLCISADTAQFSIPEMDKDIAPTLVIHALADRVSRATLAHLVLSRDAISAADARAAGIVGLTVTQEQLLEETWRIAALLATNSPAVLRGTKRMLRKTEVEPAARREIAALINGAVSAERYS